MRKLVQAGVVTLLVLIGGSLLVAFILRARHTANRIACHNNLRQIGVALHNYHDTKGRLPSGTKPADVLAPEQRLSWQFELVPYIEAWMDPAWQRAHKSSRWDIEENRQVVSMPIRIYLCPSNANQATPGSPGLAHYVGVAGVGEDAALLPRDDARAGVFGYENCPGQHSWASMGVRMEDIKDGLTSTMMVVETTWQNGPWAAGGPATVRGLDPERQPYLGENCQFGGLHRAAAAESSWFSHPQVTNILFADASVRFVTSAIEPRIFEAMATIAGGEEIGEIGDN